MSARGHALGDNQFRQVDEPPHEENEGEDCESENERNDDFLENVNVESLHDCGMIHERRSNSNRLRRKCLIPFRSGGNAWCAEKKCPC